MFSAFPVKKVTNIRSVGASFFHGNRKTERFSAGDDKANSRFFSLLCGQTSKQPLKSRMFWNSHIWIQGCVNPIVTFVCKVEQYLSIYRRSLECTSYWAIKIGSLVTNRWTTGFLTLKLWIFYFVILCKMWSRGSIQSVKIVNIIALIYQFDIVWTVHHVAICI